MVTGQQTLSSIEGSIDDLREDEQRLRTDLQKSNEQRSQLMEKRLKNIRALAQVRTSTALSDGVINEADRLSHQVRALLKAREKTIGGLQTRLTKASKKHKLDQAGYEKLTTQIAGLEAKLDKYAEQARLELASDKDYKASLDELTKAGKVYNKAKEKTVQAKKDRDSKGKPYETDPLFMYLWQQKYGSQTYKPGKIVRWLDGHIARLVNYHDARANYAVLLEIPVRLDEHLQRLDEGLTALQTTLDNREADKVRDLAGRDLADELKKARTNQRKRNGQLEQSAAEVSDIDAQLNLYAKGQDHPYLQAVQMSAAFLEQKSLDNLMDLARDTTTPSDDEIVDHIAEIDHDVERIRTRAVDQRHKLETLFQRKEEMIRLADDFRRARYDDVGSIFTPESDSNVLLEQLLGGLITGIEYWARAQSRQSWRSRPADPFRRQSSFPPFDLGMGSGGLGGGGGRRNSSEDFTTGGGF